MKNYIQEGDYIDVAAPAAVDSGDVVIIGGIVGVAVTDADSGAMVSIAMEGVFELGKAAVAFDVGDYVYHDGTECTADDTDDLIGICVEDVASGVATVKVRLMVGAQGPQGIQGEPGA